jgi:Tol biopolymer transport system component
MRVSADGGDAVKFSFPDGNDAHRHPSFIPGTNWLVLAVGELGLTVNSDDRIALMSPEGVVRMTSLNGSSPRVSPDGRLVFARGNTLWSVAFDLDKLEVSGDPAPFQDAVYYGFFSHYDISQEGSLVFWRNDADKLNTLVWVDRDGNEQPTPLSRARYRSPGISPDGDLIAVSKYTAGVPDLWTHSLSRGEATQWTSELSGETNPVWSPSGDTLYFEFGKPTDVYRIVLGGQRDPERLTDTPLNWFPKSVTPDNRYLIIDEWVDSGGAGNNVGQIDLSKNGVQGVDDIEYLIKTDYRESHPKLSPDGELLAYESNRSGSLEIWVRRYPLVDGESPVRVSISGNGRQPLWNADSRELYYWDRDDERIYAAKIDTSAGLHVETPIELFPTEPYAFDFLSNYNYDQSRNMFLMIKNPPPGSTPNQIVLVENWQELIFDQNKTTQ